MHRQSLIVAALCLALAACGTIPPTEADLAKVPVITFGQPLPKGDNFVLHFPADTPLRVRTVVQGNLFTHTAISTATVVLKHDIYAYRQFASFDNKHWVLGRRLLDSRLTVAIPGKDGKDAGVLDLQLNEK
jgi:hypothetical protein